MRRALLLSMFLMLTASASHAQGYWEHNGSIVTLQAGGERRQFHYSQPRAGLPVNPGTLLFTGRRSGNQYVGTAYVFSSRCGSRGYVVEGPVSADQRTVTMYGQAPLFDNNCRVSGHRYDTLVFSYRDADRPISQLKKMAICIGPVFAAERELTGIVTKDPDQVSSVASNILYLRERYCREVDRPPMPDYSAHVGDNCYQYSGKFRGERVYWGDCHE